MPRLLLLSLMLSASQLVAAQSIPNPLQQDILAYKLTLPRAHSLITATQEMTVHVMSQPDFQVRIFKLMQMSPAEQRTELESDPKAVAILKAHNLTTQEYQVGVPALRMALAAAAGTTGPNIIASPSNVAFAKQNIAVLKPRADSVEAMILGKPPAK